MAYFAKLGTGNIVENVISINNTVITDVNGIEQEQLGVDFINKLYNTRDVWKQTSYNNNIRKNYAGVGYTYDQARDAFIPPRTYNSWILNEDTCRWEAPIPSPASYINEENKLVQFRWNENILNWEEFTL
jgi:hypothetical protein